MRELALVSFRIVDENTRLYQHEVDHLFTPDFTDHVAAHNMERFDRCNPVAIHGVVVHETSDGCHQFRPREAMTVIRVEPCNPDSALGAEFLENEAHFVGQFVSKLGIAGDKLLAAENGNRGDLNAMSKNLGGDGVENVDNIQFYAVFRLAYDASKAAVESTLEGVLRLDKIDMAIDEAVLL